MSKDNKDIGRGNTVSLLHFTQRAHEKFPDLINSTRSLFQVINACNEDSLLLNVTILNRGLEYQLSSGDKVFEFTAKDKEELSFIESVGEFIGGGCIY